MTATLSKSERLCGKKAIAGLMEHGKGGVTGCLRYKFLKAGEADVSRILVSVPKRYFKRAVKRNLLKRRIRESYRLQKDLLPVPVDIARFPVPGPRSPSLRRDLRRHDRRSDGRGRQNRIGMPGWLKNVLIFPFVFLIKFYQVCVSPFTPPACRFTPTCSQYALEAFRKYGPFKGLYLSVRRILRCHPWGGSGYDPVP